MSLSLRISNPSIPSNPGMPLRLVYRVVFNGSEREITLPVLCKQLGISHTTLFNEIRDVIGPSIGTHGDVFMKVLATVRAKRKRSHANKWSKCPTCQGRGRLPAKQE